MVIGRAIFFIYNTICFILASIPVDDALPSSLLPKGFKPQGPPKKTTVFDSIQQDDISSFLPPGFKPTTTTSTTEKSLIDEILASIELEDISTPIPASGFKPKKNPKANPRPFKPKSPKTTTTSETESTETIRSSTPTEKSVSTNTYVIKMSKI